MKYTLALALMCVAIVSSSLALACDCLRSPEPKVALAEAAAVFVGKVKSISRGNSNWRMVTFEVGDRWKGVEGDEVTVLTHTGKASCGYQFTEATPYLVYAHFGDDAADKKTLYTSICTRTKLVTDETKAELEALGPPQMREPE